MNEKYDYLPVQLFLFGDCDLIPKKDIENIFATVVANSEHLCGIIACNERRRKMMFATIVSALDDLIGDSADIVEKVVNNAIYFKNRSCIRVFSSHQDYIWRGYKFDSVFFDDSIDTLNSERYIKMRNKTRIINFRNEQLNITSQEAEPQNDSSLWEEMILYGIKA